MTPKEYIATIPTFSNMVSLGCFISFLSVFVLCVASSETNLTSELSLVTILYRHGYRTIVGSYPNDPYDNDTYWPQGRGELTIEGINGHIKLGKWFRNRYDGFLPKKYYKNDIYVYSSNIDRTLMSAEANLAGLYSTDPEISSLPTGLNWRPIPVHTQLTSYDNKLRGGKCPKRRKKIKSVQEIIRNAIYSWKIFPYLTKHSGKKVIEVTDAHYIYDVLQIEESFNLTLPKWTKQVYPEPLRSIAVLAYPSKCLTPATARLQGGPLLKEMVTHMNNTVQGMSSPREKMFMYSGHDYTIGCLLGSLNIFDYQIIPYFASVIFELLKKKMDGLLGCCIRKNWMRNLRF